jgi:uncharacterized protein (TIGR02145 family)
MRKIITVVLMVFLWMGNSEAQNALKTNKSGVVDVKLSAANTDSLTYQKGTTVTDIDGNVYHTVKIGTQVWMVENLKVTKFNDGTAILLAPDSSSWSNLTTSGYCWYNNDAPAYKHTYGALYNWNTVKTGKLCPVGWHVPGNDDWATLIGYLGGESAAGYNLNEAGTSHWQSPMWGQPMKAVLQPFPVVAGKTMGHSPISVTMVTGGVITGMIPTLPVS